MGLLEQVSRTLRLMLFAALPATRLAGAPRGGDQVINCEPREIRGGMDRFLDSRGELHIFFPRCLALAAPFILFRLKREGFSNCTVQASDQGLSVRGRR